jgi:hypothetical protein
LSAEALMRITLFILLFIKAGYLIAQENNHTDTVGIGITAYPFFYSSAVNTGSIAIGPSVIMNSNRIALQLSVLLDTRKYTVIEMSHFGGDSYKATSTFIALFFNYKYYRFNKKACLFGMAGGMLGRRYYVNYSYGLNKIGASWLLGTGASYIPISRLEFRTSLNIGRSNKIYTPGLFVDVLLNLFHTRHAQE